MDSCGQRPTRAGRRPWRPTSGRAAPGDGARPGSRWRPARAPAARGAQGRSTRDSGFRTATSGYGSQRGCRTARRCSRIGADAGPGSPDPCSGRAGSPGPLRARRRVDHTPRASAAPCRRGSLRRTEGTGRPRRPAPGRGRRRHRSAGAAARPGHRRSAVVRRSAFAWRRVGLMAPSNHRPLIAGLRASGATQEVDTATPWSPTVAHHVARRREPPCEGSRRRRRGTRQVAMWRPRASRCQPSRLGAAAPGPRPGARGRPGQATRSTSRRGTR